MKYFIICHKIELFKRSNCCAIKQYDSSCLLAENLFKFLNGAKLKKVPSKINDGIEVCHRLLRNSYGTHKEHVKEMRLVR